MRDFDRSFLTSADIKNEWSYTSISPIRVRGLESDSFNFWPDPFIVGLGQMFLISNLRTPYVTGKGNPR